MKLKSILIYCIFIHWMLSCISLAFDCNNHKGMFAPICPHETVYGHQGNIWTSISCRIDCKWIFLLQQLYVVTYERSDRFFLQMILHTYRICSDRNWHPFYISNLEKKMRMFHLNNTNIQSMKNLLENVRIYVILQMVVNILDFSKFHLTAFNITIWYVMFFEIMQFSMLQRWQFHFAYITLHIKELLNSIQIRMNWIQIPFTTNSYIWIMIIFKTKIYFN